MKKLILLACLLLPVTGYGNFVTGYKLLEACEAALKERESAAGKASENACAGYITGIYDVHEAFIYWGDMKPKWCAPKSGMKAGQLARVVTKWLRENPQNLHLGAGSLVPNALKQAFPCP